MEKSVSAKEYKLFLRQLREQRVRAGLTQSDLAARLKETQTFISKCERGERRIDVIELRHFCDAMGVSFTSFLRNLDSLLG